MAIKINYQKFFSTALPLITNLNQDLLKSTFPFLKSRISTPNFPVDFGKETRNETNMTSKLSQNILMEKFAGRLSKKLERKELNEVIRILSHYLKDLDVKNLTERELSKLLVFKRKQIEADLELFLGAPDPLSKLTNIPCYGCGSNLHCKDDNVAGYIPSHIFKSKSNSELIETLCQRCNLLINYDHALNVVINKDQYTKMIQTIKYKPGLIILMVDLFDIRNSINPDLLNIIGQDKSIYIVGNKVDLIPKDSSSWLRRIKMVLKKELIEHNIPNQNIVGMSLVSGKTGFGVESLITNLQNLYNKEGDIYLIGSTNVGKSTLFNILLHSDYSHGYANQLYNCASTSQWPGTTLNFLKFPVSKPTPYKLAARNRRLQHLVLHKKHMEQGVFEEASTFALTRKNPYYSSLISEAFKVAKTTIPLANLVDFHAQSLTPSDMAMIMAQGSKSIIAGNESIPSTRTSNIDQSSTLHPKETPSIDFTHKLLVLKKNNASLINDLKNKNSASFNHHFRHGKWLYDTPGMIQDDQIINLLTMEELMDVLPKETINPRTCLLSPLKTLFIAGLVRIDCLDGPEQIFLTIFASETLPLNIVNTSEAERFYANNFGKSLLKVPRGDLNRLSNFPPLTSRDFEIEGADKWKASADLYLSSIGWASYASDSGTKSTLRVYTPGGKGLGVRRYAISPFAVIRKAGFSKVPYVYHQIPLEKWIY